MSLSFPHHAVSALLGYSPTCVTLYRNFYDFHERKTNTGINAIMEMDIRLDGGILCRGFISERKRI